MPVPISLNSAFDSGISSVTITPGANTAGTITITAGPTGKFHYLVALHFQRTATAALAGSATLTVTTTNLPGNPQWTFGNAMVAGGTQNDVMTSFPVPIKASAAATNTTIVFPQPGAAVGWNCIAWYGVAD